MELRPRLSIAALVFLAGCSSKSTMMMMMPPPMTMMIGPDGGTVTAGALTLVIPKGALSAMQNITVTQLDGKPPAPYTALTPMFRLEPAGLTFKLPVQVTIDGIATGKRPGIFWSTRNGFERRPTAHQDKKLIANNWHFSDVFVADGPSGQVAFTPQQHLPLGPGADMIAQTLIEDITHDGYPDLIALNRGSGTLITAAGKPDGSFGDPISTSVANPVAVAVGRFDADTLGDLLIIQAQAGRSPITATKVTFDGLRLQLGTPITIGTPSAAPAGPISSVGYNDSRGQFGLGIFVPLGGGKTDLFVSSTPALDAFTASQLPLDVKAVSGGLFSGGAFAGVDAQGAGVVGRLPSEGKTYPLSAPPRAVASRSADAFISASDDPFALLAEVFLSTANNIFELRATDTAPVPVTIPSTFTDDRGLTVADFNQDGQLDLTIFDAPNLDIDILGEHPFPITIPEPAGTDVQVVTGDLNSDGQEDIVVIGGGTVSTLFGTFQGTMPAPDGGTPDGGTPADSGSGNDPFAPVITDVSPSIGKPGDTLVITGLHLSTFTAGDDKVIFAGPTSSGVVSDMFMSGFGGGAVGVAVPDGAVNGPITWTNHHGSSNWPHTIFVTYPPVVTSLTPMSGGSNQMVTFQGTHFENLNTMTGLQLYANGSLMANGQNSLNLPITIVSPSMATAVMPVFTRMGSPAVQCSATLSLRDINAGTNGGAVSAPINFTVTGIPNCL